MNTNNNTETGFSIAAVICGALSITLGCCYLSIPFAALSIIFVCLGRQSDQRLSSMQRAAVILSIIGIIYGVVLYYNLITLAIVSYNKMMTDPGYFSEMNEKFRRIYGMGIQEFMETYLPSFQSIFHIM